MSVDSDIQVTVAKPAALNVQMRPPASLAFKLAIAGASGGSTGTAAKLNSFEQTAMSNGAQTMTLPQTAASGYTALHINGVRQSVTSYSVLGTLLSLPAGLSVTIGDLITFDFYPL